MRGSKDAYTDKQKRQAEHIESGYESRGISKAESERRAWATVNKDSGGGKRSGSGRAHPEKHDAARQSDHDEANSSGAQRTAMEKSAAAKKGWETRRHHSH